MDQDAQLPTTISSSWGLRIPMAVWGWSAIILLTTFVYGHVVGKMVEAWWQFPDYSHGFLVLPFAAYLIWAKKETLRAIEPDPSWTGIVVIGFALAILLMGEFGAELFLTRISLLILLAGLALTFGGWRMLQEMRFVLLVLLLAIPIPSIIFNQIALPLQLLASKSASVLLHSFGVPAVRLGNVIELPQMELEVAQACSGIRSLMSLFTFAILYGYVLETSVLRRIALAFASVPIAIAANAVRIFGTGVCVQYWDADKAFGFFHKFSGWMMFLVSLCCLTIVHYAMLLLPARRRHS